MQRYPLFFKQSEVIKMSSTIPLLSIKGITKRFTGITAVDHVSFEIGNNEIHALIGENGAGKSTLCKMLTGTYSIDEGHIEIQGEKAAFKGPADSMKAGINMVYQERNLIGYMTAAENISLGSEIMKGIVVDRKAAMKKAEEIRDHLQVEVPLDIPVEKLGAGEQQLVEIMRANSTVPRLLILDEPTASLGEGEIEPFLSFVKRLTKELNMSVIYITHKLEEIFAIADKVTVMADGKKTMTANISEITQDECVKAMIRSDKIKAVDVPDKDYKELEKNKILEVKELSYGGKTYEVDFYICKGEVVGFYGLVGAGRTETMEVISGIRMADKKEFIFDGEEIRSGDSYKMIQRGMILTPELRINGIFPSLNLVENVCTLFVKKFATKAGLIKNRDSRKFTEEVLRKNETKYASKNQLISELSGGNMQKIIIGRSVEVENLKLLTVDEPTAGLDLGAKSEIYLKIRNLADRLGKSVVFISSELEELQKVCDRMYIFYNGNVVKEIKRNEFDKEMILGYALGGVGNGR